MKYWNLHIFEVYAIHSDIFFKGIVSDFNNV